MPLPADLALVLITGIALGLGFAAVVAQAIGGALGSLVLARRGGSTDAPRSVLTAPHDLW